MKFKESMKRSAESMRSLAKRFTNAHKKETKEEMAPPPPGIHGFLDQKKNNQPFYKSAHRSKPWE